MSVTRPELATALAGLEQRLTVRGVAGLVALGAFLTVLKLFG